MSGGKYGNLPQSRWTNRNYQRSHVNTKANDARLCSGPTRISEGYFYDPPAYRANDLNIDVDAVVLADGELEDLGLYLFDRDTDVVLDLHALRINPLMGPILKKRMGAPPEAIKDRGDKRIEHATRMLKDVPDSYLFVVFLALADEFSPDFAKAIRDEYPQRERRCHALAEALPEALAYGLAKAGVGEGAGDAGGGSEKEEVSLENLNGVPSSEHADKLRKRIALDAGEPCEKHGDVKCDWCIGALVADLQRLTTSNNN